jgi:hypothetical protein
MPVVAPNFDKALQEALCLLLVRTAGTLTVLTTMPAALGQAKRVASAIRAYLEGNLVCGVTQMKTPILGCCAWNFYIP